MNLTVVVAAHVKPSLNITGDVFTETVSLDVVNQGVSVHVTQSKIHAILRLHVAVMVFVQDDLTQMEVGFPRQMGLFIMTQTFPILYPIRFLLIMIPDLNFSFITLFRYTSTFVTRLTSLCFLIISIIFLNTELFMSLKKSFPKSFWFEVGC